MTNSIEPICPECTEAIMEDDPMFPDCVVWRCPDCLHRCTPSTYREEWGKIHCSRTIPGFYDGKIPFVRLFIYGLIGSAIIVAAALFLA
jgi:hypothetical protein